MRTRLRYGCQYRTESATAILTERLLALARGVAAVAHLVRRRVERLERRIRVFFRRGETDLTKNVEVEGVLAVRFMLKRPIYP